MKSVELKLRASIRRSRRLERAMEAAGRRFLGCELKRSYWQQAVANLKAAEKQQPMLFVAADA